MTTRLLKEGVLGLMRVSIKRLKSRKCARWLVPNWVSKPSVVRVRVGMAMTPALQMRTLRPRALLRSRNSFAPARTLARELRSMRRSSTRLGSRMSERAVLPRSRSRTVQYVVAPVAAIARAVSTPIPEEQPVMRKVLSCNLPSRPSS